MRSSPLRALDVSPGTAPEDLVGAVAAALAGAGPVLPVRPDLAPAPASRPQPPPGTAAVVGTSGSTGAPKLVVLPAQALRASATATLDRLGGPGQWLLALPAHHVSGFQVLVRSAVGGTVPRVLPEAGGFTAAAFVRAADSMSPGRRYASLVPTQVARLLGDRDGTRALTALDGVLVGGAALTAPLQRRAEAVGVRLVTTYGMTETCGGCVYDGVPLDGVTARLDPDGRVRLAGPVVAAGYLGDRERTAQRFGVEADGVRSFLTEDAGELDAAGGLRVLGRLDDVVTTGGVKVAPRPVEEALLGLPGVAEAVVVAVPDEEWGQRVGAVLVPRRGAGRPSTAHLRDLLRPTVPAPALPRQVRWLDAIPTLPSGKPDRALLVRLLADDGGTI